MTQTAEQVLNEVKKVLGGNSELETKIKNAILELKQDFYLNVRDNEALEYSDFLSHSGYLYDNFENCDFAQKLFMDAKPQLTEYGAFDFNEFDNVIESINELKREFRKTRKEVLLLEGLLWQLHWIYYKFLS